MPDTEGPSSGDLANRLRRVHRHLRKWAKRTGTSCYRLYERDIGDWPLIVDWYEGEVVVWIFPRTRDDTPEAVATYTAAVPGQILAGLDLPPERLHLKNRHRQRGEEGREQYEKLAEAGVTRTVSEHGLTFEVNLSDYLDVGLFLDHRDTRARVMAEAQGRRVLNLFAYTGSFSVHAIAGGAASTLTVDLSATYLAWTGRNLALNGVAVDDRHRLERADCLQFLADRSEPEFDLIILDPPTFSNSKKMTKTFAVARDHVWLINRCRNLLRPGGILYFSTNDRGFDLAPVGILPFAQRQEITPDSIPEDFRNRKIHRCWRWVR